VRREDLLAVTMRCLAELGPRGTTGREICRRAGVSHGLLRHYFDNPDDLLLESYQRLCDHFIARFEAALGEPGDPREAFDRMFATLFDAEWEQADVLGAWMAFWSLVRSSEAFAAVSEAYNARLRTLLRGALERLPRGEGAVAVEAAIPILSALMDGLWLEVCLAPGRLPRERAVELWRLAVRRLTA
jgi:AcrR family transcriptional regulator